MNWGCPYEHNGDCLKAGKDCEPGKPGCVLNGKVCFIGQEEKEENDDA